MVVVCQIYACHFCRKRTVHRCNLRKSVPVKIEDEELPENQGKKRKKKKRKREKNAGLTLKSPDDPVENAKPSDSRYDACQLIGLLLWQHTFS